MDWGDLGQPPYPHQGQITQCATAAGPTDL